MKFIMQEVGSEAPSPVVQLESERSKRPDGCSYEVQNKNRAGARKDFGGVSYLGIR
jgi:hypothetical protein